MIHVKSPSIASRSSAIIDSVFARDVSTASLSLAVEMLNYDKVRLETRVNAAIRTAETQLRSAVRTIGTAESRPLRIINRKLSPVAVSSNTITVTTVNSFFIGTVHQTIVANLLCPY